MEKTGAERGAACEKNKRIAATLLLLALLGGVLAAAAWHVYRMEREACFGRLRGYTEQVGGEIRRTYAADRAYLERISALFAQSDLARTRSGWAPRSTHWGNPA